MDALQNFRRLFAYDAWANHETFASLTNATAVPPRAQKIMAHIVAAEAIWFSRVQMDPAGNQPFAVWPDLNLEQCQMQLDSIIMSWKEYLASLSAAKLYQEISYTNTKGESFSNTIADILQHVIMHSAYHRGQIATDLRSAGFTPAITDFIYAVRHGLIE